VVIPPNRPSRREDQLDRVYKTTREKYEAAITDIRECHERGQPVLVGTTSHREQPRSSASCWSKAKLPHQVLNAKQHAKEADIVAQAGRAEDDHHRHQHGGPRHRHRAGRQRREADPGLEADESLDAGQEQGPARQAARRSGDRCTRPSRPPGGLRIIATERHESRRIDNQLRGRSGRQGDPGSRAST
jgi:preprotein translocase subunit SecA